MEETSGEIPYVREVEITATPQGVTQFRFIGESATVDVGLTDHVLAELLEEAEEEFDEIYADLEAMREDFASAQDKDGGPDE